MRINVDIDEELLEEAVSVSQLKSKKDLIHDALLEYIRLKNEKTLPNWPVQ